MAKKAPEATASVTLDASAVVAALAERPLTPAELCCVVGGGGATLDRMRGLLLIAEAQQAGLVELRDGRVRAQRWVHDGHGRTLRGWRVWVRDQCGDLECKAFEPTLARVRLQLDAWHQLGRHGL